MTYREVFAVLRGEALRRQRDYRLVLWGGWHQAMFERQKKMPPLQPLMRKMTPQPKMSRNALREQVLAMAKAMGAKVIDRRIKKEA